MVSKHFPDIAQQAHPVHDLGDYLASQPQERDLEDLEVNMPIPRARGFATGKFLSGSISCSSSISGSDSIGVCEEKTSLVSKS